MKAPAHLERKREWARGIIGENEKLPLKLRQAVLNVLEGLPDGEQLCHGDFHPGNILVTARGAVIIDWMTASRGTAAGDVARTAIILEAAQPPPGTPMRWLIEWIPRPVSLCLLEKLFSNPPHCPGFIRHLARRDGSQFHGSMPAGRTGTPDQHDRGSLEQRQSGVTCPLAYGV